jgi:cobalt-zinc-cadmium efflux system outer membrane protein
MLYAVVAVLAPLRVGAQSLPLTESEALARLSNTSPRVQAIRTALDLSRVDVLAASRWPNPQPSVTRESVAGVTEFLTTVSQVLPVTGRRGLEVEAATAHVAASTSRADEEIRRLRADLRLAFAELAAAQDRERELTAARDRLRVLAEALHKRESAGDAAGFDRLRAEREALDLETDLTIATTERAQAQARLASFLDGVNDASSIVTVTSSQAPVAVPSLEALLAQAEAARGELKAFRQEIVAARFAERAAERRRIPEPELTAGTKSSTAAGGDVGSVVTVRATIPLFDRSKPERALAIARANQAEARAASFRQVLRGQVTALRASVLQRRAAAERYRAEAMSRADQLERIAQVSYDAGERGILELLDAFQTGTSARVRQTALDLAVRQVEIELAYATGWEDVR